MEPTRLWLIRHGEVEAPFVGTFTGRTDVGLSDVGRHQAQAIAAFLADAHVDAIVMSPRERARLTARPLIQATGLEAKVVDDLAEMDFGDWETKAWPDIEGEWPDEAAAFVEATGAKAFPGGEDTDGFQARVEAALRRICEQHPGQAVAIFAHAGTNRAALSWLTGLPYLDTFAFAQDYGCVNAAAWDGTHGQIALLNVVPGPQSEHQGDGGRNIE